MALQWQAMYYAMCGEALLVALLCIPLPFVFHKALIYVLRKFWSLAPVKVLVVVYMIAVGALLWESVQGEAKYRALKAEASHGEAGVGATLMHDNQMHRHQRNTYIAASAEFLVMVLYGFNHYLNKLQKYRDQKAALKEEVAALKKEKEAKTQ